MGETKDLPSREELFERDRAAWNLPSPKIVHAVGPVREVWPVRETGAPDDEPPDEPAAA